MFYPFTQQSPKYDVVTFKDHTMIKHQFSCSKQVTSAAKPTVDSGLKSDTTSPVSLNSLWLWHKGLTLTNRSHSLVDKFPLQFNAFLFGTQQVSYGSLTTINCTLWLPDCSRSFCIGQWLWGLPRGCSTTCWASWVVDGQEGETSLPVTVLRQLLVLSLLGHCRPYRLHAPAAAASFSW